MPFSKVTLSFSQVLQPFRTSSRCRDLAGFSVVVHGRRPEHIAANLLSTTFTHRQLDCCCKVTKPMMSRFHRRAKKPDDSPVRMRKLIGIKGLAYFVQRPE